MSRTKPGPCDGHPDAIDLNEAEAWGKELAEKALKIKAGDKGLIPAIPKGPDADLMFHPYGVMQYFPGIVMPRRTINMEKCKYPACMQCVDNCAGKAIDFKANPPTINAKKTCINCSLCDRMCPEEAIEIPAEDLRLMRTMKKIDMAKCKYPECTLCIDYCPMNAIDFSVNPPVFRRSCEGDDLCWTICPTGAIELTNLDVTHRAGHGGHENARPRRNIVDEREAAGRFRRLVPKDKVGKEGAVMDMKRTPRYYIHKLMED